MTKKNGMIRRVLKVSLGPLCIMLGLACMICGQIMIGGTYPVAPDHPGSIQMAIGAAMVLVGFFCAPSPWRKEP